MRFVARKTPVVAGAALLLAVSACSDVTTPSSPLSPRSSARTASVGDGRLTATPNTTRYADTEKKPATGRSGSATLLVRALYNKDGSTDLEVSTGGSLDGAPAAPGLMSKLQVKAFAGSGTAPIFTKNYNGLSTAYVIYHYSSIGRGASFQVQSNIGGIDGKRIDVVTVTDTAKARPDLAVSDVTAPAQAYVNVPVLISATVRELNGDVGATDNCVLYADGTEIDRVQSQWVDAGGNVGCTFNHAFATTGVKALLVSAEHVVPGDWDLANNSDTSSITIVDPVTPLHGNGVARQITGQYEEGYSYDYYDYGYNTSTSVIPRYTRESYNTEIVRLNGTLRGLSGDRPTSVSISISSGGATLGTSALNLSFNGYCSYASNAAGYSVHFCSNQYGNGTFQAGHTATQATYFSLYYNAFYDAPSGQYVYTATPSAYSNSANGTPLAKWGSDLTIDARFVSPTNTYQALATTQLTAYSYSYNQPYTCWNDYYYYYYNYCSGYTRNEVGTRGSFIF